MLSVLGRSRGVRISEEPFHHSSAFGDEKGTLRRLFIRSLAYLCDSDKGGRTTTAIALQQVSNRSVVFWIASNSHWSGSTMDRPKKFIQDVIHKVVKLQVSDDN